jgi:hypothetical protein
MSVWMMVAAVTRESRDYTSYGRRRHGEQGERRWLLPYSFLGLLDGPKIEDVLLLLHGPRLGLWPGLPQCLVRPCVKLLLEQTKQFFLKKDTPNK